LTWRLEGKRKGARTFGFWERLESNRGGVQLKKILRRGQHPTTTQKKKKKKGAIKELTPCKGGEERGGGRGRQ